MIQEIKTLQDVILYEFKRSRKAVMSFGELWSVCSMAAPNLPGFHYEDSLPGRKYFVREMIRHIRHLSEVYGLVAVDWIVNDKKIDRISLTQKGRHFLPEIEFTHTDRASTRSNRTVAQSQSKEASLTLL